MRGREPESKQVHRGKHVIREARCIGVVLLMRRSDSWYKGRRAHRLPRARRTLMTLVWNGAY